jgi:hypothetical protein
MPKPPKAVHTGEAKGRDTAVMAGPFVGPRKKTLGLPVGTEAFANDD